MNKTIILALIYLCRAIGVLTEIASDPKPRFKVLVIHETGGHHIKYSERAKLWLDNPVYVQL